MSVLTSAKPSDLQKHFTSSYLQWHSCHMPHTDGCLPPRYLRGNSISCCLLSASSRASQFELSFSFHLVNEEFSHPGTEALFCMGKFSEMNEEGRRAEAYSLKRKKKTPKHALEDVKHVTPHTHFN